MLSTGGSKSLLPSCRAMGPLCCTLGPRGGVEWELQTPTSLVSGFGVRSDCPRQIYLPCCEPQFLIPQVGFWCDIF